MLAKYETASQYFEESLYEEDDWKADIYVVEDLVSQSTVLFVDIVSTGHANAIRQDEDDYHSVEDAVLRGDGRHFS